MASTPEYTLFHVALTDLYAKGTLTLDKEDDDVPDFDDEVWTRAVRHVHESGQFTPEMLSSPACLSVIRETYRILMRGVSRGLSTEVPAGLSESLSQDVFIFSGFKTFHEMREVSHMLRDPETGGLKSFHQFEQDVRQIHETYNHNYLRAEYQFAEASAHMAERWKTFERDNGPDVMLQYRTANDERVRDEHRNLHNVTLPMDDPFWNSYLPPLGWNCRCTTVMVRASKFPKSNSEEACRMGEAATDGPKKSIFRFNPGKTEKIFPPKHPYLPKGCGNCDKNLRLAYDAESEKCRACKAIAECKGKTKHNDIERVKEYIKKSQKEFDTIDESVWERISFYKETGGFVAKHLKKDPDIANKNGGNEAEVNVLSRIAKTSGKKVYRLPENVDDKLPMLNRQYQDFLKYDKNGKLRGFPDAYFDEQTWDVKYIGTAKQETIRKYFKEARKADNVIFVGQPEDAVGEAIAREIGRQLKQGNVEYLPDVFTENGKGCLVCLWQKKGPFKGL